MGRIGGDEFLIALPNCDEVGAVNLAERIRRVVGQAGKPGVPRVSVSVGLATAPAGSTESPQQLLERADRALYVAKAAGGDTVGRSE